jgi:hypothetical protein
VNVHEEIIHDNKGEVVHGFFFVVEGNECEK